MAAETTEMLFERFGPGYRWMVTGTSMVGMVAMVLSSTSVNVAVPDVMGAFGVGQDRAQWLSTGFLAATTAGMLLNAWLTTTFGARLTFLTVLVMFEAGALIGGFGAEIEIVIVSRLMQGLAAGIIQPLALATIFTVFPPERRGTAVGLFGMGVVLAPALGPAIGGFAIDLFSWRSVFFLPVPICFVAFLMGMVFMPSKPLPERMPPFDWIGLALLCMGLSFILDSVASGQRLGWASDQLVAELVTGIAAAIGFVAWELHAKAPLLDIGIFRNPQFASVAMVGILFGMGMFGSIYIISVFVQTIGGYTPMRAGLLLIPSGIVMVMMNPIAGRLADSVPTYRTIAVGLAMFGAGFALMANADVNTPFWLFVAYTLINRCGLSSVIPSINTTALRALTPQQIAQGSGAVNFLRMLGGALGTSLLVTFLEIRTQVHATALTATQTWGNSTTTKLLDQVEFLMGQAGVAATVQEPGAITYLAQMVYIRASGLGFQDTFMAMAVLVWTALLPTALLRHVALRKKRLAAAAALAEAAAR